MSDPWQKASPRERAGCITCVAATLQGIPPPRLAVLLLPFSRFCQAQLEVTTSLGTGSEQIVRFS